jgi:hypothetical protein
MKRLVAGLLGVLLVVVGCARATDGSAVAGPRDVDPAAFFAGAVPTYGQSLTDRELATRAYLRAMRRLDPCGFTTREALARLGEVLSAGTMFEFTSCELEVKVPGTADPKLVSVMVAMADVGADSPVFTVGDRPVYPYYDATCGLQVPLPLDELPGAPVQSGHQRPYLQLAELIAESGCDFIEEFAKALVVALDPMHLPLRDALAVYPVRAAEQDPCAVLGMLDGVTAWDAGAEMPYLCAFTLSRDRSDVDVRLVLRPRSPKDSAGDFLLEERDGVEVYVGNEYCAAIAFVGDELDRRTSGGASVGMGEWATAPAASVNVDAPHCDVATDVAVAAAKAFG